MCLWDLDNSGVILVFSEWNCRWCQSHFIRQNVNLVNSYISSSRLKFVWLLFAFEKAGASSPLWLLQNSQFIFCLCLSANVSGLSCSFCNTEQVVFEYLPVFFWFITSSESLTCHSVIPLQVPVCNPIDILSVWL